MSMAAADILFGEVLKRYTAREIPSSILLCGEWRETRPLEGLSVLDATPLFFNTFGKYAALLYAGADLTVGYSGLMPYDGAAVDFLLSNGVKVIDCAADNAPFDVILDNAAVNAHRESRYGYTELTRSGVHRYTGLDKRVFLADSGRIKAIETCLGTGEGCLRALRASGIEPASKRVIVFGYGRVGRGIAMYMNEAGASVQAVDFAERVKFAPYVEGIDFHDTSAVSKAVSEADIIISATGVKDSLFPFAEFFCLSHAVLVNMGVEDEYGTGVPLERVMNRKMSFNFILEEPTRLRYIDPTLALHTYGAELLVKNRIGSGLTVPTPEIERKFLDALYEASLITPEIAKMEETLPV